MRVSISAVALLLAAFALAHPAPEPDETLEERFSRFDYYDMPTKLAVPCDLTTGPDGRVWVQYFGVNKLAAIDPKTREIEEFEIPYKNLPLNITLPGQAPGRSGLTACAVQPGSDGNIWAASGVRNEFVKVTLATKKVEVFPASSPLGNLQPLNDLWRGKDGMWYSQTTANLITLVNYKTNKQTSYKVGGSPVGMLVAADDNLWFAEFLGNRIGRLNQTTGAIKYFDVPKIMQGPAVMRAETRQNGKNYIWWTGTLGNSMGRVDIATGKMDIFPAAQLDSLPIEDDSDSFGRVWYSTATTNTLNYIDPARGYRNFQIQEPDTLLGYPVGVPPAANIAIHYGPQNKMWFTAPTLNRVGTYQLLACGKNYKKCTKDQN